MTANLESNIASKRWQQEKNSVAVRASKMQRYELNSEGKLGTRVVIALLGVTKSASQLFTENKVQRKSHSHSCGNQGNKWFKGWGRRLLRW